ncbi:MAG TPA: SDR family NAD(P)-dependent oxidoreductase [Kofleriaceae bacterium]|nr:SDR family NAD(P)-dependent oxidoreductase [Kofleriaceae bacterium]
MNLQDRVVVITGAGSGIGRATALAFAEKGARVAACDVHQPNLDSLTKELGDRALLVRKVDVSDRLAMRLFADEVHGHVAAADIVVNNAGVAIGASFLETSLEDFDWLLGVNLKGVIHGCHFFLPRMVERGTGGHIINVSSIFGIFAPPHVSAYCTSKFAVRGFSQSLREEMAAHKIGVTAICPGMIATGIIEGGRMAGTTADRKGMLAKTFSERGAPPGKVAKAILDAVRTNPAVRTVGADARVLAALTRVAPRTLSRLGGQIQRRFGV